MSNGSQSFRLREKVVNTPQLMHLHSFENIIEYLDSRCEEDTEVSPNSKDFDNQRYSYNEDKKVAILNVQGPLTYRPVTVMGFDCGGASYQQLKQDFSFLVKSGAKTVALMVDSPGGEAHGLFDSARYIKKLAKDNDVKIVAYVDGLSASAGYGLTSIADKVIASNNSEMGSIGVVVRLINDSKALEKEGFKRTFITAGASKVPFTSDGEFREGFLEDIQAKVDAMYEEFTGFVAENRGISVDAVRSTEAKTFLTKEAISLGLADDVMSLEDFYSYLAEIAQNNSGTDMLKSDLFKFKSDKPDEAYMQELELYKTKFAEAEASIVAKDQAHALELVAKDEAFAELLTKFDSVQEQLAVFQAEKEAAELAAKQAVAQARLDKLTAAVGTEKAAELSAKFESADDALFEAMVGALEFASAGEKQSALFTEVGSAEAGTKVETNPSMEEALAAAIKKQYKTK